MCLWTFKKFKILLEISTDTRFSALGSQMKFCKNQSSEKSQFFIGAKFSMMSIFVSIWKKWKSKKQKSITQPFTSYALGLPLTVLRNEVSDADSNSLNWVIGDIH